MKQELLDQEFITISVPHRLTVERVSDLLCGAIEGGSNYWVTSMDRMGGIPRSQAEYRHEVPFIDGGYLEVVDGEEDKTYNLTRERIEIGLKIMSEKFPLTFKDFIEKNEDAGTSDVFLQCCIFEDVIYG